MSPTIRIDAEVFEALKEQAEPFVDTPNSVLRRVLGLRAVTDSPPLEDEPERRGPRRSTKSSSAPRKRARSRSARATPGSILAEEHYEVPILAILNEKGGRAPSREVIDALGDRLNGQLTRTDWDQLASGQTRWRNRAQFVRLRLIERGDMEKDSPRGVWEISDQGRERISSSR
jgi:Mrr N-terminal domain